MMTHFFKTLIVEDNLIYRNMLSTILSEKYPFMQVFEAETCSQANAMFEEGAYDLIFLDVKLPDGNGIELAKRIRSMAKQKSPKVALMTGNQIEEYETKSKLAGADFFFDKAGLSLDEFYALVQTAMIESDAMQYVNKTTAVH